MISIELIKEDLKKNLKKSRYEHSLQVANTAKRLAKVYNVDEDKAYLAGLIHDCAKYAKGEEFAAKLYNVKLPKKYLENNKLIHTYVGPIKARVDYKIEDEEILDAIAAHTTGRIPMTMLDMIIFISDYIEPSRAFKGVDEVRHMAYEDIVLASIMKLDMNIEFLIKQRASIDISTIETRNYLLEKRNG